MTTYQNALAYLDGLNRFGIKLGLERISRLLELMGNPQNGYKTVHVTGTNGKGSTAAMLTEILLAAKIKTGLYISPHLVSYTERMRVDGECISEMDFAACIFAVRKFAEQMKAEGDESPTQFEVLTAAAFLYFSRMQVEYAVIEVGLGGLLDSTNVIVPEVSVITNVTLEHADRCGGTLAGVAEHKAGIIKDGVPVVTGARDEGLEIIRRAAEMKNSDLFIAGEDFCGKFEGAEGEEQKISFSSDLLGFSALYRMRLLGLHQIENGAIAVMTALVLSNADQRVTKEVIGQALSRAVWEGRFEVLRNGYAPIVIDGAHNPAGTAMLRANLDCYFPHRHIVFLLGILRDKDVARMVKTLIRPEDTVVVTEPDSERAALPEEVAARIQAAKVESCAKIADGVRRARELAASEQALLCVAGSLYLIGAARQILLADRLDACDEE